MNYAIIAAGEGSRLAAEGITAPKPLVKVGGECLIDRLLRVFSENDADRIVVICNDITPLVDRHLTRLEREGRLPLQHIVKTTPSSMHSFYELSPLLDDGKPFLMTTVDTIFREDEFARYIRCFRETAADGVMGVTDFIDDEKPLYVDTDDDMNITAFLDSDPRPRYISGGIYGLHPGALGTLRRAIARGESRMRNFQRALLADGARLKAWPFSKVLDIDHAGDIAKAEAFLNAERP